MFKKQIYFFLIILFSINFTFAQNIFEVLGLGRIPEKNSHRQTLKGLKNLQNQREIKVSLSANLNTVQAGTSFKVFLNASEIIIPISPDVFILDGGSVAEIHKLSKTSYFATINVNENAKQVFVQVEAEKIENLQGVKNAVASNGVNVYVKGGENNNLSNDSPGISTVGKVLDDSKSNLSNLIEKILASVSSLPQNTQNNITARNLSSNQNTFGLNNSNTNPNKSNSQNNNSFLSKMLASMFGESGGSGRGGGGNKGENLGNSNSGDIGSGSAGGSGNVGGRNGGNGNGGTKLGESSGGGGTVLSAAQSQVTGSDSQNSSILNELARVRRENVKYLESQITTSKKQNLPQAVKDYERQLAAEKINLKQLEDKISTDKTASAPDTSVEKEIVVEKPEDLLRGAKVSGSYFLECKFNEKDECEQIPEGKQDMLVELTGKDKNGKVITQRYILSPDVQNGKPMPYVEDKFLAGPGSFKDAKNAKYGIINTDGKTYTEVVIDPKKGDKVQDKPIDYVEPIKSQEKLPTANTPKK